MTRREKVGGFGVLGALLVGVLGVFFAGGAAAEPAATSRYPYDPACPWGRLSNGKGMLLRCISEQEASRLTATAAASVSAVAAEAPPPVDSAAPGASASAAPAEPPAPSDKVNVTVGPVTAELGRLPVAEKRLSAARSRIAQCFDKGGLKGTQGEVVVRFLVRPRGRAEGVSVAKKVNVTARAARCVASVIDRRYVGQPEAPVVGASVVVKVSKPEK